jgi:hypothetical protein
MNAYDQARVIVLGSLAILALVILIGVARALYAKRKGYIFDSHGEMVKPKMSQEELNIAIAELDARIKSSRESTNEKGDQ